MTFKVQGQNLIHLRRTDFVSPLLGSWKGLFTVISKTKGEVKRYNDL